MPPGTEGNSISAARPFQRKSRTTRAPSRALRCGANATLGSQGNVVARMSNGFPATVERSARETANELPEPTSVVPGQIDEREHRFVGAGAEHQADDVHRGAAVGQRKRAFDRRAGGQGRIRLDLHTADRQLATGAAPRATAVLAKCHRQLEPRAW